MVFFYCLSLLSTGKPLILWAALLIKKEDLIFSLCLLTSHLFLMYTSEKSSPISCSAAEF